MELTADGAKLTSAADDVLAGSPLAVAGLFVAVVQARLAEAGLPWRYDPEYVRDDAQAGTPGSPSPIYVTSAYAEADDVDNVLPRVVVAVPSATLTQTVVGNRAGIRTNDRREAFHAHDALSVMLRCYGKTAGEAYTLGHVVRHHLAACRLVIAELFHLHQVDLPVLNEPVRERLAQGQGPAWVSSVGTNIQVKVTWTTTPIAPLLQALDAEGFVKLALRRFTE